MSTSQNAAILAALKAGRCVDPMTALHKFSTMRLSGRILELRQAGYAITTTMVKTRTGKRIAVYRMAPGQECAA